jgi:hypothetical protein
VSFEVEVVGAGEGGEKTYVCPVVSVSCESSGFDLLVKKSESKKKEK